eukprot:11788066-Prorocentrum_lima.AAC.1
MRAEQVVRMLCLAAKQTQWACAVATLHHLVGYGAKAGARTFNALIDACGKGEQDGAASST